MNKVSSQKQILVGNGFSLSNANGDFIGFSNVALRSDYVEGNHSLPVGYIEGIYVKASYWQKQSFGAKRKFVLKWAQLLK